MGSASADVSASTMSSGMHASKGSILRAKANENASHGLPTPPISDDEHEKDSRPKAAQLRLNHSGSIEDRPRDSAPWYHFERPLGATELSYFLPSRRDGVNDMYLHLGFRAPAWLMSRARVRAVWAYQRLVHAPLAAQVHMDPGVYDSARFVYILPRSAHDVLTEADASLEMRVHVRGEGKDSLISEYLNGPRTLCNECLARLVLTSAPLSGSGDIIRPIPTGSPSLESKPPFPAGHEGGGSNAPGGLTDYDLLICVVHFLGDGMALHRFANELFSLLAGRDKDGHVRTTEELEALVHREWATRWSHVRVDPGVLESEDSQEGQCLKASGSISTRVLPPALEDSLPKVEGRFHRAAGKVDFECSQKKAIGGHSFPREKNSIRQTLVPTVFFDERKTKAILRRCKENGVSVASAIFTLSAFAWSSLKRLDSRDSPGSELPIMMYTALNLRPYLLPCTTATEDVSYWFTAIGYLNIILPSFLPSFHSGSGETSDHVTSDSSALRKLFWYRARDVKRQIIQGSKHPLLMSRTHEMARMRAERACIWAREDDERAAGIRTFPSSVKNTRASTLTSASSSTSGVLAPEKLWTLPPAPSTALMGLSLLGSLDATYMHASFPDITLHTLTTGSRQRHGAALLFAYTFCGRLWLSLGYDVNGFADGMMEKWWDAVLCGVDEFLLN